MTRLAACAEAGFVDAALQLPGVRERLEGAFGQAWRRALETLARWTIASAGLEVVNRLAATRREVIAYRMGAALAPGALEV